jgi:hypothetical protein
MPIGGELGVPEGDTRGCHDYIRHGQRRHGDGKSAIVQFERDQDQGACDPSNNDNTIETNRVHRD